MTDIISEALEAVKRAGFEVTDSRFPYTYHHDYIRMKGNPGKTSRGDVAAFMLENTKSEEEYDSSLVYGALLYLFSYQPEKVNGEVAILLSKMKEKSIYKEEKK